MRKQILFLTAILGAATSSYAQSDSIYLNTVVVTGSRYSSDLRHLPYDVSVVNRERLTADYQPSVLPALSQ